MTDTFNEQQPPALDSTDLNNDSSANERNLNEKNPLEFGIPASITSDDNVEPAGNATKQSCEVSPKPSSQPATGKQTNLSLDQQLSKAKRDLESMVIKYARSESENLQNKAKSEQLDKKLKRAIKDNESLANRIKILTNDKNQLSDTLSAKVAQLTVLEQKNCSLSNVQEGKLKDLESELDQLRKTNEDLTKSIDTYKSKENELLDFSERLSMKQLLLQAELDKALESTPDYKKQCDQLVIENCDLKNKIDELTAQCQLDRESLNQERKLVEKLRSDYHELELECRRKLEEQENEMKVIKRKHLIATRELLRQIKGLQMANDKMNDTQSGNKLSTQT